MQMIKNEPHWEKGDFDKLINSLSKEDSVKRHEIRYALFRVKTEEAGGNPAEPEHKSISDYIQTIEGSGIPSQFSDSWDIGAVTPEIEIVNRLWSIYQEHDQLMRRVSVELDKKDNPQTLAIKASALEKKEARRFKKEQKGK